MKRLVFVFAFIFLAGVLFAPAPLGAAQGNQPVGPFGVIEAYEAPAAAGELGVGWTRVRFHWGEIQPDSADQWVEQRVGDTDIAAEVAAGRQVIGLLIGIPDWARGPDLLPAGLTLAHDDPGNSFAVFVRRLVGRYVGQIDHWIIWNEPDIWDKNTPGHTWDGDEADFARLMRIAYLAAHDANPDVVLHLAAMTFFWDNNYGRVQYLERLMEALAADPEAAQNGYYFDIATAHLYFQPNQIFDILAIWQEILARHGLGDKTWWLVETNAPVSDDPGWPVESVTLAVSQQDQAYYMAQVAATALAAGVERIGVFKLIDTASDRAANPEPFGLLRADGSRRPAFDAYRVVIKRLSGVTAAHRDRWDEQAHIRLEHSDGTQTHVLFARNGLPQEAIIGARGDSALLVDAFGNAQTVRAQNGNFSVALPGSACTQPIGDTCMIGGAPYYLVQARPLVVQVSSNSAAVDFPERVSFALDYATDAEIVAATLRYDVAKTTCVEVATEVPLQVDTPGTLRWEWIMVRSGNPPPGSELWWEWELTDAAGNTFTTPRQSVRLDDPRFEWHTVSGDQITLNWVRGDDVGPRLLTAAEAALVRLEEEMGIPYDRHVTFYIYPSSEEMRDAILYVQDWAGGVAFSAYDTVLLGVPPGQVNGWGVRVVAHELAHLVIGQFGLSCIGGDRPTWLEEGLAMVAEGTPDGQTQQELAAGVRDNSFVPLRSLNGAFPAHSSNARAAYSQSDSLTRYLLDTAGPDAMQELILALAAGDRIDAALQTVYGFDLDGLEARWRAAIGAPPRAPLPTPTPVVAAAVPTIAPVAGLSDRATPAAIPLTTPAPADESAPAAPSICFGMPLLVLGMGLPLAFRRRAAHKSR